MKAKKPFSEFRRWRLQLELTQAEAAQALDRSWRIINAYDRGEREPPVVIVLAMRALYDHPDLQLADEPYKWLKGLSSG